MIYFPIEVFSNIMGFCGDNYEDKRNRLWNSISIKKYTTSSARIMYKCSKKYVVLARDVNNAYPSILTGYTSRYWYNICLKLENERYEIEDFHQENMWALRTKFNHRSKFEDDSD